MGERASKRQTDRQTDRQTELELENLILQGFYFKLSQKPV